MCGYADVQIVKCIMPNLESAYAQLENHLHIHSFAHLHIHRFVKYLKKT